MTLNKAVISYKQRSENHPPDVFCKKSGFENVNLRHAQENSCNEVLFYAALFEKLLYRKCCPAAFANIYSTGQIFDRTPLSSKTIPFLVSFSVPVTYVAVLN